MYGSEKAWCCLPGKWENMAPWKQILHYEADADQGICIGIKMAVLISLLECGKLEENIK